MRKKLLAFLTVLCVIICAFAVTACNDNGNEPENPQQPSHTHTFDQRVATSDYLASAANCTEPAKYYYSCTCGEKGTETFTDGNAL